MNSAPFLLSLADSRPMYIQIMDNIKQCVITGQWPPGHSLPSIREMAVALKVSVITVKRAYQELEQEGLIATRRGKGSYVSGHTDIISQQKEAELNAHLAEAIKVARLLNLSPEELTERLSRLASQHLQRGK